jgi:hypothetical protein
LAIPFAAAKSPNSGSQFENPHVTMNYTFQTYMKNGVTFDLVEEQVKLLQGKAAKELSAGGKDLELKDTRAWKALCALKGNIDIPFKYKLEHIQELVDHINSSPEIKLEFVRLIILPQMEVFQSKISCNPQNLIALFKFVSGFTGTLWNALSMHYALNPEPAEGIDAKTLLILLKNSRDNVVTIKEGSSESMLNQLEEKAVDYDMISDAGGYFKDGSNTQIAHKISAIRGKEVVCYKGEQMITDGSGEIPLGQSDKKEEERLTFLDQSHTTGADVTQKRDAISLVTIGQNMLLRDLLQSVWRLRGLDKSQKVRFLISEEVSAIIRQALHLNEKAPIHFDQILSFVIANQAKQQGLDNYKALRQELALIPQSILLQVLLNETIAPIARLQAFAHLQSEWIKPAFRSPKERYGTLPFMMESDQVIGVDRKNCISNIEGLFTKMPWLEEAGISQEKWLKEVDVIIKHLENDVPAKLPSPSRDIENDQTVEVEVKAEAQNQSQTQTELESQEAHSKKSDEKQAFMDAKEFQSCGTFQAFLEKKLDCSISYGENFYLGLGTYKSPCPSFSLRSFFDAYPELKGYALAFEGIDITGSMLEWAYKNNSEMQTASDFKMFGSNRVPIHHLSIKDSKVTLLSAQEAKGCRATDEYYNLTLGFNDSSRKLSDSEKFKVVKIKFLSGESQFDKSEEEFLRKWFLSQGVAHMRDFYEKIVIAGPGQKLKAADYRSDSTLKRLFAQQY